jgi:small subunit ribosomal protein S1
MVKKLKGVYQMSEKKVNEEILDNENTIIETTEANQETVTEVAAVNEKVDESVENTVEGVATKEPSMDDYKDDIDSATGKLNVGEIVEATILSVGATELIVDFGYALDGIIPTSEIFMSDDESLQDKYHSGDSIKAKIVKKDSEGNVILSVKKAEQVLIWDELEKAFQEGNTIEVKVAEVVKGGVTCRIKGVRAFIPASLLSVKYIEDLKTYVGKELAVKIADFDKEDKKVILSRKAIELKEQASKKKELLASIKKGDRLTGTVTKLMKFGAFIDLGGIDGLAHNNDLSWSKIKHPSDIVKEGDSVDVYVIDVDKEKERIALGLKDVNEDPWNESKNDFKVGNVYEGTVVRLVAFGAFVKLADNFEGLVHISQISEKRVEDPSEVLAVGDTVKVKIMEIDDATRKIRLSIREAVMSENKVEVSKYNTDERAMTNLGDVFKSVLKDIRN